MNSTVYSLMECTYFYETFNCYIRRINDVIRADCIVEKSEEYRHLMEACSLLRMAKEQFMILYDLIEQEEERKENREDDE